MLRAFFSNRLFLGCFVVYVLMIASLLFYSQHIERESRELEARTQRLLQQGGQADTVSVGEDTAPPATEGRRQTEPLFKMEAPGATSNTMLERPVELPTVDRDALFEPNMETSPDEPAKALKDMAEAPTNKQTIEFINVQFERAIDLLQEKEDIRNRRKYFQRADGRMSFTQLPEDKARLMEIKYERYDILRRIGEKVPGSIEVELIRHPSGTLG